MIWPGLQSEAVRILGRCDASESSHAAASELIRAMFERAQLMDTVSTEIAKAYRDLGAGRPVPVAVRSSATAEDMAEASFAGQQETYLWIQGADDLVKAVARCWGSLFTPQAIAYRLHFGVPTRDLAMAVVVQRMVDAEAAGVMITLDPVTGDRSQITIESSYGLGLAVVGGEVTPDRFAVDKITYDVRSRTITEKPFAYRHDGQSGVVTVDVDEGTRGLPSITDEEVYALARLGRSVEKAHGSPQDIEWAIGRGSSGEREIFLLQTRPETVWSRKPKTAISDPNVPILQRMLAAISQPIRLTDGPRSAPPADPAASTSPVSATHAASGNPAPGATDAASARSSAVAAPASRAASDASHGSRPAA